MRNSRCLLNPGDMLVSVPARGVEITAEFVLCRRRNRCAAYCHGARLLDMSSLVICFWGKRAEEKGTIHQTAESMTGMA